MLKKLSFFPVCLPFMCVLAGCGTAPPSPRSPAVFETSHITARLSPGLASDVTLYAVGLVGTP